MTGIYPWNVRQSIALEDHPRISGSFAVEKNLWDGREVGVIVITRGDRKHRTQRKVYYGTLVLAHGRDDQYGIRTADGETHTIHKNRGVDVYDMTRTKVSK